MKLCYKYLAAMAIAAAGLTACQDDFKEETISAPVATLQPNMSIMELKQQYWNDATNYIDTIGIVRDTIFNDNNEIESIIYPVDENGNRKYDVRNYIIRGRVISSDEAGNVFKSLVIQDETAALALSINSYNLYLRYRQGQEVVIDLKGMYIGKYNGLVQLGMPEWYEAGSAWEATFMAPEFFEDHVQLNGWPEIAKVDTLEVNSFSELPSNPEGLCRWQSQLVKFNNVEFQNAGTQQFSEYHSSGVNQNIVDAEGNTLPVRTSGYSNFWNKYLPEGRGDVVCILSYYGTTGWQLLLNDYEGCMNFGHPTVAPGTEDNPLTVAQVVANIQAGKTRSGWVSGYIVGAVAPEVTEVKSNADVEWCADPVLSNTLVIGATPDTKDISQALVIALPSGSALRQYGNLPDNPGVYGKAISVKGTFSKYMGTYGVLDNNGKAAEFHIEGVEVSGGGAAAGEGTAASPYNVAKALQVAAANGETSDVSVYTEGYVISGSIDTGYGNATWVIADDKAGTGASIKVFRCKDLGDEKFTDANKVKVGDKIVVYAPIVNYMGNTPETSYGYLYSINGSTSGGGTTPDTPDTPSTGAGSETSPYSVADVLGGATGSGVWVKCYIVGWVDGMTLSSGATFNDAATAATNLLVADTPDAADVAKCVPVQLPSGAVRTGLNLQDNPGNYKKEVLLKGNLEKYFGAAGIKSVTEYKFVD